MSQVAFASRKRTRAAARDDPPSQRNFVSLRVKQAICHKKQKHPSLGPTELAAWANRTFKPRAEVDRNIVLKSLKKEDRLITLPDKYLDRSKIPAANMLVRDAAVKLFVEDVIAHGRTVSSLQVCLHARKVTKDLGLPPNKMPKFSKAWVTRFLARTDLKHHKLFGEAGSVKKQVVLEDRRLLKELTRFYHPDNIFNFDESAYFYRKKAVYTIAPVGAELSGTKQDKTRVTMAVCTNASGTERLPLLIIGTAAMPVPFRLQREVIHWVGSNDQVQDPLFHYAHSKKGWMNGDIFRAWLTELDQRMKAENRKILLLVDNVNSHNLKDKDGVKLQLDNVNVQFLPKNTTAVLQPMDQGIIKATKDGIYHLRDLRDYNFYVNKVLSVETIRNAWIKADIVHDRTDNMYFWS